MIEHFSTRGRGSAESIEYWNELLNATYSGLVVDPVESLFKAQMARWQMGDMTMIAPQSSAAVVARRNPGAANRTAQSVVIHVVQTGKCSLTQRGRTAHLGPGDMVICAGEEFYEFDVPVHHQLLVVEMDRAPVESRVQHLDDMIARNISGQLATTRLLRNFLLSLWREGAANFDPALGQSYAAVLIDMLATGLQQRDPAASGPASPLLARMKGVVAAHLSDPDLTPSQLAAELGVSLRKLQSAVAQAGTTPGSYIMQSRLELAAQRLLMERDLSVTSIAYTSGFTDAAYFARRFHERYGLSPSQYRQRH